MKKRMPFWRGATGFAVSCLMTIVGLQLTGCGGPTEQRVVDSQSARLAESSIYPGAYRVPEEAITGVDQSEAQVVQDRVGQLVDRCMNDAGFAYEPSSMPATPPAYEAIYGAVDPQWVSVYGYASPAWIAGLGDQVIVDDPNAPPPQASTVTSPEDAALLGVESEVTVKSDTGRIIGRYRPDGCYWKANLAVRPDYFRYLDLDGQFNQIVNTAHQAVKQSSEYSEAQSDWVKCMGREGYKVSDPELMPELDTTKIDASAIAQAQKDIACKTSTGFLRTWSRLLAEEENRQFGAHPGLIEELTRIQADDYRRATDGQ